MPGSREAGLQFRSWKNLGGTGGSSGSHHLCVPPPWAGATSRGSSAGLLWAWGPDQHCLHSAPSCPSALKAVAGAVQGHRFLVGKCGGQMGKEAKWGGVAPMEGWASVVLKEVQEIIVIFDRQVGWGSRYERCLSGFMSSGRRFSKGSRTLEAPCSLT